MSDTVVERDLTDQEIAARLASLTEVQHAAGDAQRADLDCEAARMAERYRYISPFTTAASSLAEYLRNPEGRLMLGLHDIDLMIRGFGRGELAYVTGRPHQGKTQVLLNTVVHNRTKRILIFTPDEPRELVLTKLAAIITGRSAEQIEEEVKAGSDMLHRIAAQKFPNLFVIDDSLPLGKMMDALHEAQDAWGEACDAVIIDYLELIPSADETQRVDLKSQALKRWTKEADVPVLCLHQSSRSNGTMGQKVGMGSMKYGGESEAIYVLGVWRKREDESLDDWERRRHENTVTVGIDKNKRPPCKRGEKDFFLDPKTGLVRPLRSDDLGAPTGMPTTAEQALAARRQTMDGSPVSQPTDNTMEIF